MEIVGKFRDAGSMLWMNLDAQERQLVIYGLLWLVGMILHNFRLARIERLRRELREGDRDVPHAAAHT